MRDTDEDWRIIAKKEPFFGVHTHESNLQRNLTPERIDAFYHTGETEIERITTIMGHIYGQFAPNYAIDFGCGVGRQTLAMANYAETVVGVDVAPEMITLAVKRSDESGQRNVSFRDDIPAESCDWINSHIVFQHIPPERGYSILTQLLETLNPGGLLSIQITLFRDTRCLKNMNNHLKTFRWDGAVVHARTGTRHPPGTISMYDYDLNEILALFVHFGIERFYFEHTDHGGHHGGLFLGRKS